MSFTTLIDELSDDERREALAGARGFPEVARRWEGLWARVRVLGGRDSGEAVPELVAAQRSVGDVRNELAALGTARSLPVGPLKLADLWPWCWRVAARLRELEAGLPVLQRPASFCSPRWGVQHVWSCRKPTAGLARKGERYYICITLSGDYAGLRWRWAAGYGVRRRIAPLFGFTWYGRTRRPLTHASQFVGLRFLSCGREALDSDDDGGGPAIVRVARFGAGDDWNRAVLGRRILRNPPCPFGFTCPCHVCSVGHVEDRDGVVCAAAVHPACWELRTCATCACEQWFDPETRSCVGCGGRATAPNGKGP